MSTKRCAWCGGEPCCCRATTVWGNGWMEGRDSRFNHGMACYCQRCCESAIDWYVWLPRDGKLAPFMVARRYWTLQEAQSQRRNAAAQGLTVLWYQMVNGGSVKVQPFRRWGWNYVLAWMMDHAPAWAVGWVEWLAVKSSPSDW